MPVREPVSAESLDGDIIPREHTASCDEIVDGIPLRCRHVIREMVDTEGAYVDALRSIIEGYREPMITHEHLPIKSDDVSDLFNNLADLYAFSQSLYQQLERASTNMVALANCFLDNETGFRMYTTYCTGYPKSVEILSNAQQQPIVAEFLKGCQLALGQMLPLGAYLLKPVQRILKYHLLLADLLKQYGKIFGEDNEEWTELKKAQETMGGVANYINAMKRKHEASVRAQEIISQCVGWDTNLPVGGLMQEDSFRCVNKNGSQRIFYMFEKLLLITKKNKEGIMVYKGHIPYSNLTVNESCKDSLCFEVKSTKNKSLSLTLAAKDEQQRGLWVIELRKLMLEHHPNLPPHAKELMLKSLMAKDIGELFKDMSVKSPKAVDRHEIEIEVQSQGEESPSAGSKESRIRTQNVNAQESALQRARAKARRLSMDSMSSAAKVSPDRSIMRQHPSSSADSDEEPDAVFLSKEVQPGVEKPEVIYPERHLEAAKSSASRPSYTAPISVKSRRTQNASVCNHWIAAGKHIRQQTSVPGDTAIGNKEHLKHTVGLVSKLVKRYSELVEEDEATITGDPNGSTSSISSNALAPVQKDTSAGNVGKQHCSRAGTSKRAPVLPTIPGIKPVAAQVAHEQVRRQVMPADRRIHLRRTKSARVQLVITDKKDIRVCRLKRCASYSGQNSLLSGTTLVRLDPAFAGHHQTKSIGYLRREGLKLNAVVNSMTSCRKVRTLSQNSSTSHEFSKPPRPVDGGKVRNLIARFSVQPM